MLRHVVLFVWNDDATDAQKQALADELPKMPAAIEVIRRYEFGADQGINPGNCDFAVVADFDDRAGYLAYRDHPAHGALLENFVNPIVARRASVQYQLP
jgi:Stress responsive A/B Barrel Domain